MGDRNFKDNPFFLRRPNYGWSSDDDESAYIELPRVYMGLSPEHIPSRSGDGTPQQEQAEVRRRETQIMPRRRAPALNLRRDLPVPVQRNLAAETAAGREQIAARRIQMQRDRDLFWKILNNSRPRSRTPPQCSTPVVGISPTLSPPSILGSPVGSVSERAPDFRSSQNELLVQEQRNKKHRRDQQHGGSSNPYFSLFRALDPRTPSFSNNSSQTHGSDFVESTYTDHAESVAGSSEPIAGSSQPSAGLPKPSARPSSQPIAPPPAQPMARSSSEPIAGSSTEPIAGPSAAIAGTSSAPIAGTSSAPIAGPSSAPIAGPSSAPIAGPSAPMARPTGPTVAVGKRAKKKEKESPLSELTMDALQEEYTRWLNRSLNSEQRVRNYNQISGQTWRQRLYQNLNRMPSQNLIQMSNSPRQAMAEVVTDEMAVPQPMSSEAPLETPEAQLGGIPDAPDRPQQYGNCVDDRHEIGALGINPQREGEGENAGASSDAARLTLDEVVVEAPEDINPPAPSTPGTQADQPDGGDQTAALPTAQPTEAAGTSASDADNNSSQRATNISIKSVENPQPGTSNGVGGKRKRDSTDDNRRPDTVAEFNLIMLRHLECPVCLDWMEPPIAQCRRGHVVCPRCRSKLNACPVCRTPFSSVRNRAMEGVAEMLRYPCRFSCGREAGVHGRAAHEGSCPLRRYHCPAHCCSYNRTAMPRDELAAHFLSKHSSIIRAGTHHKFFLSVRMELHKSFIILALDQFFHLNVDIDLHTWGAVLHVSFIGPKKLCKYFTYEITVKGTVALRKLVYVRNTHSDLDKLSLSVPSQDRFHLTAEQAHNYIQSDKNNTEKYMAFTLQINQLKDFNECDEDSD